MVFSKTSWTNITPPGLTINANGPWPSFGAVWVEVSKSNPNIVYVCIDDTGLFKSIDYGQTWVECGSGTATGGGPTTTKLDSPFCVRIDPADPTHLVATQGVRGTSLGFWVSNDSGQTWTMPAAFSSAVTTAGVFLNDVTTLAVNPTNFNHLLIGSHGSWTGYTGGGILETQDGGNSFTIHYPVATWPNSTQGIGFLYDPASGQGNASTWIVMTDGDGFWRTANSGSSWTKVYSGNQPHGGTQICYTKAGNIFSGGPAKSTDNGLTWSDVTNLPVNFYVYSFGVDSSGKIYTNNAYTGDNTLGFNTSVYTSTNEGASWSSSSQQFSDGPYVVKFSLESGLIYMANWAAGLWVLKAIDNGVTLTTSRLSVSVL